MLKQTPNCSKMILLVLLNALLVVISAISIQDDCPSHDRFVKGTTVLKNKPPQNVNLVKNVIGMFPIHDKDCYTILRFENSMWS